MPSKVTHHQSKKISSMWKEWKTNRNLRLEVARSIAGEGCHSMLQPQKSIHSLDQWENLQDPPSNLMVKKPGFPVKISPKKPSNDPWVSNWFRENSQENHFFVGKIHGFPVKISPWIPSISGTHTCQGCSNWWGSRWGGFLAHVHVESVQGDLRWDAAAASSYRDLYTFRGCMGFPLFLVSGRENGAYKGGAPYFAQLVQLESHCWVYGRYIHSL